MDQAARARVLQLAVWLALLGDLLLLGWWNQTLAAAGSVVLLLLALAGLGGLWLLRGGAVPASRLDAGFGLLAAAIVASSIFSLDPSRSWRAGWQWLACIWLFYFGLLLFRRGWTVAAFSRGVLIVVALLLVSAYYQLYLWLAVWYAAGPWPMLLPPGVPRVWGVTASPNILAVLLNMALLLLLGYRQAAGRWLPALALWLVAALPMLLLPASRSGWLGLLVGLGAFWLLGQLARDDLAGLVTGRSGRRLLLLSGGALLLFLLLVITLRPGSLALDAGSDVGFRTRFWRLALEMWRADPLLGSGLNTFASHYMQQYPAPFGIIFVAAHNLYFHGLAEMGVVGLAALLLLTAQISRLIWRQRAALAAPWPRALTAILVAFGVHALFDTPEAWVAALALFCLAALLATIYPHPPPRRYPGIVTTAWGAAWLLLLGSGLIGNLAARRYAAAMDAAQAGAWATATRDLTRAARLLPYDDSSILLAQGQLYGALAAVDPAYLPQAVDAYERLIDLEPGWSANHANLAALYWQQGQTAAALQALAAARTLAPESPVYWINSALWHQEVDPAAAAADLATASGLSRSWSAAPLFGGSGPQAPAPIGEDPATAAASYWTQVTADPTDSAAFAGLGRVLLQTGDAAGAAEALRRAAALDTVQSNLGQGTGLQNGISVWRALLPQSGLAARDALTDRLRTQSAYGPGSGGAGSYPATVFGRPGLPVDLLPQLRCPSVSAAWAEVLLPARAWAEDAGDEAALAWLSALLEGDGDGTVSCWPATAEDGR